MKNNYPPTALETKGCPPHYWLINNLNEGKCFKCGVIKDFSKLVNRSEKQQIYVEKAREGGKKGGRR